MQMTIARNKTQIHGDGQYLPLVASSSTLSILSGPDVGHKSMDPISKYMHKHLHTT